MVDELILNNWFTRNGLAEGTKKFYKTVVNKYSAFIGKSLEELIDEAEKEEKMA
jgi:hypothetical protein